ncbi:MAG TPA: [FeFe] hydrogenase H-cluster maturation GTPase HydF [Candidatus Avibacteroides excrementipullorum]|jgi:[FeFe] hydrogenase H-cluster maturation GTPase HydF|nr:[FeFe] hydrogenase H-cluster maturation GTPase HydF [Candidatus Avibacteroides excrementipullorum]
MNETPASERIHIAIAGKRNSGKSSLLNMMTGQRLAIVSDVPGTTTDPVSKAIEINPLGPCVLIDTAGFDDDGTLGEDRVGQTRKIFGKADAVIMVCSDTDIAQEMQWKKMADDKGIPTVWVLGKSDAYTADELEKMIRIMTEKTGERPVPVSALTGKGQDKLTAALQEKLGSKMQAERTILGNMVKEGDAVLLVMPQDKQAPKGRLILPQAQTIRELLERKCIITCCVPESMSEAIGKLSAAPDLIITDSQVFDLVYGNKPAESRITSFSVLFARYKGDIDYFVKSAEKIKELKDGDRILIAEACTHAPLSEDIGREKIPMMLRKKSGCRLDIDIVSGSDFPDDLSGYALVIHCGGCMFNRQHIMNRVERARSQGVPMTNYGITIAFLRQILDKIEY